MGYLVVLYWCVRTPMLYLQAYVGMCVFAAGAPRRAGWPPILLLGAAGFLLTWGLDELMGIYRLALLGVFLLLAAAARAGWRVSPWDALLLAGNGYLAQHMAGSLKSLARIIPAVDAWTWENLGLVVVDVACYGGMYLVLYLLFRPDTGRAAQLDERAKVSFFLLTILLCLGMSQLTKNGGMEARISDDLYAIGSGSLLLFLQFGLAKRNVLAHNVEAMREIVHQQRVQYESSRDNIALVNEKYHDLKQMLRALQGGAVSRQALEDLDQRISDYDAPVRTGNDILDVLLTEKRMLCKKQGIRITTLAHGADLAFVEDMDLYALLSNALTNAIEAVSQLPEGEERFIHLNLTREGNTAIIHIENPFCGTLELEDGLPQTRKDRRYHGFGMRSMERIAEQYGGALSVTQRDGRFLLDILLCAPVSGRIRCKTSNLRGSD